ncbi:MAG TPA: AbrB/MazE/SpoVT family DNA-binding domain-containing protein [Desulfobacteraceae bacterium]|nr:AbrB/MazE/SpoVT family DNA-binding domain-containing protein [Desulfobacteraceae bacterium]
MTTTAKITSKGQVTLPKRVRQILATDTVEVVVEGDRIVLIPIKSVAGSLAQYAAAEEKPLTEIRDRVWQEVADAGKS